MSRIPQKNDAKWTDLEMAGLAMSYYLSSLARGTIIPCALRGELKRACEGWHRALAASVSKDGA